MNKGHTLTKEAHQLRRRALEQVYLGNDREAAVLFGESNDIFLEASIAYQERSRDIMHYAYFTWIGLTVLYIASALVVMHVLFLLLQN